MRLVTLEHILIETRGNQTKAAEMLQVNRGTLRGYVEGNKKGVVIEEDDGTLRLYGRLGNSNKP